MYRRVRPGDGTANRYPVPWWRQEAGDAAGTSNAAARYNSDTDSDSSSDVERLSRPSGSLFDCNICLQTARDSVITICGHLFCWPCLYQWRTAAPNQHICPVCWNALDDYRIIAIYGRNRTQQVQEQQRRNGIPPRPTAGNMLMQQPPATRPSSQFLTISFGDGHSVSFGFGAFPFGLITITFDYVEPQPDTEAFRNTDPTRIQDEQIMAKMFLYLFILSIGWLVLI